MALPGYDFNEFKEGRAPAPAVAKYYYDYIQKHSLSPFMAPYTTVTMIQPLTCKVSAFLLKLTNANGFGFDFE